MQEAPANPQPKPEDPSSSGSLDDCMLPKEEGKGTLNLQRYYYLIYPLVCVSHLSMVAAEETPIILILKMNAMKNVQ